MIKAGGGIRARAVHRGVRALGTVAVAVEVQSVAVEAQALDTRSEQVEHLVALLELGEARLVADDLRPDERPELGLRNAQLFLAERCEIAEDPHEEPGVDELGQERRRLGQQYVPYVRPAWSRARAGVPRSR